MRISSSETLTVAEQDERRREARRAYSRAYGRKYRARHPDRLKNYRALNIEQALIRESAYRAKRKEQNREERILSDQKSAAKRGGWVPLSMTPSELRTWLAAQAKVCSFPGCDRTEKLCIDHDHRTGKVRGLLCAGHNTKLGSIERPGFVRAALEYLTHHGSVNPLES